LSVSLHAATGNWQSDPWLLHFVGRVTSWLSKTVLTALVFKCDVVLLSAQAMQRRARATAHLHQQPWYRLH